MVFNIKFLSFWTFNVWRVYTSPPALCLTPTKKGWHSSTAFLLLSHNLKTICFSSQSWPKSFPKCPNFLRRLSLAMAFRHVVALSLLNVALSDMEALVWRWEIHLTSPKKLARGGPQKSRWVEVTSMNPTLDFHSVRWLLFLVKPFVWDHVVMKSYTVALISSVISCFISVKSCCLRVVCLSRWWFQFFMFTRSPLFRGRLPVWGIMFNWVAQQWMHWKEQTLHTVSFIRKNHFNYNEWKSRFSIDSLNL